MSITKPKNPYRSGLLIPGNRTELIESAIYQDTDILTFDLEDTVAPNKKEEARRAMKDYVEIGKKSWADLFLRINNDPRYIEADLEACVLPGVKGIIIPKVESVERMLYIESIIDRLERERGIEKNTIITNMLIESTLGYMNMREIAANTKRGHSMNLGTEDFSREMGIKMEVGDELFVPNYELAIVATCYGMVPMGLVGSMTDTRDMKKLAWIVERSKKAGLKGAWCGNVNQLPIINQGFAPTAEEYANAKQIVDVFEEAVAKGDGTPQINGKTIDISVADRARKVVRQQEEIDAFEEYKKSFDVK